MPCLSGRSQHVLCKKDCQPGCAYCVNTAYSIGKLCCNEPLDNSTNKNIRVLACQLMKDAHRIAKLSQP